MSTLRPTLRDTKEPGLTYAQTYVRVWESVKRRRELIHGKLEEGRLTCAIGAYFHDANVPLNSKAIDEIAAYNDSFPDLTPNQRWRKVLAWLKLTAPTVGRAR